MQRSLPPVLRAFCFATVFFCVAMFVSEYIATHHFHLDRVPYNRMTLQEDDDFADMVMFIYRFGSFHTSAFFSPEWGAHFMYPAPLALFYAFFFLFPVATNWFLCTAVALCVAGSVLLFRALRKRGLSFDSSLIFASVSLLFSYPMYFVLNRANMEIFVWVLTGAGVLFFLKDRPWLAATFLAVAGACKFYPFFFLGLMLFRKQYRQIAYALLLGAAVSIACIWATTGNFATGRDGIASGLEDFRQIYVLHRRYLEIGLDHSIFGLIKKFMTHVPPPDQLAHIVTIYLAVAGTIALAIFFVRIRKLPLINQVLFISTACITLPPLSSDYTLLHLYTPWVMIALAATEAWVLRSETPRGFWPLTICMAILLSSQTEIILHGERLNGQIKCVTLLVLAVISATVPLRSENTLLEAQTV